MGEQKECLRSKDLMDSEVVMTGVRVLLFVPAPGGDGEENATQIVGDLEDSFVLIGGEG